MGNRIGIVTTGYAVVYSAVNNWLRGFYGPATRSIASGIVCVIVALNLWSILVVFDKTLAFSLITNWRSESLIVLIITLTIVDLALVETGKADRWASAAMDRYSFLKRFRSELSVALIIVTCMGFAWVLRFG